MSEFDRSGFDRRSIRRPRKQAPLPPSRSNETSKIEIQNDASVKRVLTSKRDFIALPLQPPRDTEVKVAENFDDSHTVLKQIQTQINQLEFDASLKQNQVSPINLTTRTRYDAMESVLNTGISDLKTNHHNDDEINDDDINNNFYRGGTRSSVQGVPRNQIEQQKVKQIVQLQRTVSDSKKVELLRKHIKQREFIITKKVDEQKVKRFEIYKKRCKYSFLVIR
jgi:hypothetical protein